MSIINRLSDLGSSIGNSFKSRVGAALSGDDDENGDGDNGADSDGGDHRGAAAPVVALNDDSARAILGLDAKATLDDVRASAAARAKGAHAGAMAGNAAAADDLDRIASAAEFLEERLLPLVDEPLPSASGRVRATARR
jgi:hypothetical protein